MPLMIIFCLLSYLLFNINFSSYILRELQFFFLFTFVLSASQTSVKHCELLYPVQTMLYKLSLLWLLDKNKYNLCKNTVNTVKLQYLLLQQKVILQLQKLDRGISY